MIAVGAAVRGTCNDPTQEDYDEGIVTGREWSGNGWRLVVAWKVAAESYAETPDDLVELRAGEGRL